MNVDHIYPRGVANSVYKISEEADDIVAFCDFDRKLTADDMKVQLDADQRVITMSKTLDKWDAGYVGMTFVPAACRARYDEAVAGLRAELGDDCAVEQVLVRLSEGGSRPSIVDISGHGWYEIDDPSERAMAERALASSEVQTIVGLGEG
jgi:choline kinase